MMEYFLGVDIGTGSTKAIAVGADGTVYKTAQNYYPTQIAEPGFNEQDPELIFHAFLTAIRKVVEEMGHQPRAIALSSAMHSLILLDAHNQPICPMLTWADSRSGAIAHRLYQSEFASELYQLCGTPLYAMSPLSKIIWFRENHEALFKQANRFAGIKEYIWHKLFNVFETDYSLASATGLFDIQKLRWNEFALDLAGISVDQLPQVVNTTHNRSDLNVDIAQSIGLQPDTIFVIGASDGCLANLGSFAFDEGTAALSIGTSGAIRITSSKPIFNFSAMTFNYLLDEKTFICGGAINNGGMVIDWLINDFIQNEKIKDYDSLFEAINKISPGSEGLLFLPYLLGERSPVWDAKSCGVFFGIRPQHTQAHFMRAVVEGVCMALTQVMHAVEQSSGAIQQINLSGGFINSSVWMQMLADITGKKLALFQTSDASAIGATFLAQRVLGNVAFYQELILSDNHADNKFVKPDPQVHAVYKPYFEVYQQLYPALKSPMAKLYQLGKS
jgi:gluconokinase